jgi:16S rRNA (cytidine1402-2'-O)-methyltransferase
MVSARSGQVEQNEEDQVQMGELHGCYDSSVKESPGESGTHWIVATPIGSLDDLGPRARRILASVEIILAEDTRVTRTLLAHAGVAAGRRMRSFHDHNERARLPWVLAQLEQGQWCAGQRRRHAGDLGPGWAGPGGLRPPGSGSAACPGRAPSRRAGGAAASAAAVLAGFLPP